MIPGSFTCECQDGYRLTEDGRNCRDVNECEEVEGMCAGGDCINLDGYYECLCPTGFKVSRGGTICVGKGCLKSSPTFHKLSVTYSKYSYLYGVTLFGVMLSCCSP